MKALSIDALIATHDPRRKSWIVSANDPLSDFPIQNLPFGIFSDSVDTRPRVGVAIGDWIVDLTVLQDAGLLLAQARGVFARSTLNDFIALGQHMWRRLRVVLSDLLTEGTPTLRDDAVLRQRAMVERQQASLHLPIDIAGYTDFYSSKAHATHVGAMFRDPSNALLPNWSEMPIAYNGRASSIVVSGTPVRRPIGQLRLADRERPVVAATQKLDLELEMAFIVGKTSQLGKPISCDRADEHIFGMVLLNDWSARDIQQWEYVPLGPFNSKGFATTISPWIVTMDALEPFRCAAPVQSPLPLPYLRHTGARGVDLHLEVALQPGQSIATSSDADVDADADAAASLSPAGTTTPAPTPTPTAPFILSRTHFRDIYWTMAQQLAHHTLSGCNIRIGDVMGSGTVSGDRPGTWGCLLEMTQNGRSPLTLPTGQHRRFLEDGDTVILRGWGQVDGYRVGFGDCAGMILPALLADNDTTVAEGDEDR